MTEEKKIKDNVSEREQFVKDYLEFKVDCVCNNIFDLDEIIKLYEVWIKTV